MSILNNSIFQVDGLTCLERIESQGIMLIFFDPFDMALNIDSEIERTEYLIEFLQIFSKVFQQIYRVLSDDGNLFIPLDLNGSMFILSDIDLNKYIGIVLEQIFGDRNLRGEIIWPNNPMPQKAEYETILWYSKTEAFTCNPQSRSLTEDEYERILTQISPLYPFKDENGAFGLSPYLTTHISDPAFVYEWKGFLPRQGHSWRFSKGELDKLDQEGRIYYPSEKLISIPLEYPLLKKYLHESEELRPEVQMGNLWDDILPELPKTYRSLEDSFVSYGSERPTALLERIILMGSNPGDCVLDPYCHLGEALVAAQSNNREWIGCELEEGRYFASIFRIEDRFDLTTDQDFSIANQEVFKNKYPIIESTYETIAILKDYLQPQFILDQPVNVEETRYYEFKEIKGKNPVGSIKSLADQYAVAFLNSEGGRIYWGIRDIDRKVTGVALNYGQRDEIRRVVTEKLTKIQPAIAPTQYRIEFHQVHSHQDNTPIPDLYVIELVVPRVSQDHLYFTGSNDTYVKTDGGKKKLTGPEIQKEIIKRLRISDSNNQKQAG